MLKERVMKEKNINLIIQETISKTIKSKLMENADDVTLQEVKNILYAAHKGLNNAQRKLIFTMGDNDPFFISIQQLDSKIQELMNGDILGRFYTT